MPYLAGNLRKLFAGSVISVPMPTWLLNGVNRFFLACQSLAAACKPAYRRNDR
jgi:hypothetical protein